MRAAIVALALGACAYEHTFKAVDAGGTGGPTTISFVGDGTTNVNEGGTSNVQISLAGSAPSTDVVVHLVSEDAGRLDILAPDFLFTPTSWDQPQLVTLRANEDDDAVDDVVVVDATAPGGLTGRLQVTIHDDDTMRFIADRSPIDVDEGQGVMMTLELSAQPTSDVVVQATIEPQDQITIVTNLTFTPQDWQAGRFVQLMSLHDTNTTDETTTLTYAAPGIPSLMIPVHNHDTGP